MIQEMINKNYNKGKGLSCKPAPLPERCPIYDAAGGTKLSQCPLVDMIELPVGTRWYFDFTFFNVMSIRGFTGVLVIFEATVRYL